MIWCSVYAFENQGPLFMVQPYGATFIEHTSRVKYLVDTSLTGDRVVTKMKFCLERQR